MIVVKTSMRKIPQSCSRCTYYVNSIWYGGWHRACLAVSAYLPAGKHITIKPTKGRPEWCPLREV